MGLTREAIEKVVLEHVEAENARDMARVMRTYAEGAVFEDVPQGKNFEGKAAIADSYQERFVAVDLGILPDLTSPSGRLWLAITRPGVLLRMLRARLGGR
ncbi:MAG: nuclear transport factor 2 family protein [Deltaproteobacteria bacterium]|nr:nuclear transport factor 2 family protein [Deltaproteobacteria bacterium]